MIVEGDFVGELARSVEMYKRSFNLLRYNNHMGTVLTRSSNDSVTLVATPLKITQEFSTEMQSLAKTEYNKFTYFSIKIKNVNRGKEVNKTISVTFTTCFLILKFYWFLVCDTIINHQSSISINYI